MKHLKTPGELNESSESIIETSGSNHNLSNKVKAEIKACFENTVLCARSHSPKESYDYAERMANHVIRMIEGESIKEGWAFSDDIKDKIKRDEPEWFSWYDWSNMTEEYMCYDEESKRGKILGVKGDSIKSWILDKKFTEEDWEIIGNLEIAETCSIGSLIITRVK
jgi:hypothetical protein